MLTRLATLFREHPPTEATEASRARILVYYAIGSLLSVGVLSGVIELATRSISWAAGDGFTLALHKHDP